MYLFVVPCCCCCGSLQRVVVVNALAIVNFYTSKFFFLECPSAFPLYIRHLSELCVPYSRITREFVYRNIFRTFRLCSSTISSSEVGQHFSWDSSFLYKSYLWPSSSNKDDVLLQDFSSLAAYSWGCCNDFHGRMCSKVEFNPLSNSMTVYYPSSWSYGQQQDYPIQLRSSHTVYVDDGVAGGTSQPVLKDSTHCN